MDKKNLALSNMEILSIILYCDYDVFVSNMRKSQREQHLNSCEWRKLFYYLQIAITKIHKALHFNNYTFWKSYTHWIRNAYPGDKSRDKLYRGIYNVSLNDDYVSDISLNTITSFSESFDVANNFAERRGMIFSINDAYKAIYDGDLIAANVSWISRYKYESEWIVLPTTFNMQSK